MTTTEVVPSPASMSWALEISTNYLWIRIFTIFATGCTTSIFLRIVAPSFVIRTSPLASWIILSIPFGPKLVRMTSEIAINRQLLLHFPAYIFVDLMSLAFSDTFDGFYWDFYYSPLITRNFQIKKFRFKICHIFNTEILEYSEVNYLWESFVSLRYLVFKHHRVSPIFRGIFHN